MELSLSILWPLPEGLTGAEPGVCFHVDDFQGDMASLGMTLNLEIPEHLCPEKELTFSFTHIRDFRPQQLIAKTPFLKNISDALDLADRARYEKQSARSIAERLRSWPDLPVDPADFVLEGGESPRSESPSSMDRLLNMVAMPEDGLSSPGGFAPFTKALGQHLQDVLAHIYSQEPFRHLEAMWRSLHLLFSRSGRDMALRCRVLPFEQGSLATALEQVLPDLVQDLPHVILVDQPLDSSPLSAQLMEQVSGIAETLLVPAVCWVGPGFFNLEAWDDFGRLAFLPHHLDRGEYGKWRTLMQKPASSWVGLTCNRFLLRQAYTAGSADQGSSFGFDEQDWLWGSPIFAFAGLMEASMGMYGWPTHVSEWKRVRLEGMDMTQSSSRHLPTETTFTDERLQQLSKIGIFPIMGALGKDFVFTPLDTTWGGEPLSNQLFLSAISQEIIRIQEDFQGAPYSSAVRKHLQKGFARVWHEHGDVQPEALDIDVQETTAGCRSRISVKPSRAMLPSGKEVSLDVDW